LKKWYQSWTVWTNVIIVALFILQYALDQQWIPLPWEGLVVGVVNLLLRIKTGEQITVPILRKSETPES
jgi:hypothetical protein